MRCLRGYSNSLAWLGVLAGSLLVANADVLIDSFNVGPFSLDFEDGAIRVNGDSAQLAGGTRQISLGDETNPFLPHNSASLESGSGFLQYNRQQNGLLSIGYGSFAFVPMQLNLIPGGEDRFELRVLEAPSPFTLFIAIHDNSFFGTVHESGFNIRGPGTYELPFSVFGPVELDNIGGIRLQFLRSSNPDFGGPGLYRFDSLAVVVPEPSPLAIAGLLSVVLFLTRLVGRIQSWNTNTTPNKSVLDLISRAGTDISPPR